MLPSLIDSPVPGEGNRATEGNLRLLMRKKDVMLHSQEIILAMSALLLVATAAILQVAKR